MLFRLAWRNLWRNPRRTLITAASVFFAVVLATFMSSMQEGVWDNMIDNLVSLQTGQLRVERANYRDEQVLDNGFEASEALRQQLLDLEGIQAVHPRLEGIVLASHTRYIHPDGTSTGSGRPSVQEGADRMTRNREDRTRIGLVQGLDAEAMALRKERLVEGRMPAFAEQADSSSSSSGRRVGQALLGQELAEYLHAGIGDTVVLLGQGYRGAVAAQLVCIEGLVDLGNPDLNRATVYLPLPDAQRLFAAEGLWTGLILEPEPYSDLDALSETALAEAARFAPNDRLEPAAALWAAPTWAVMLPEIKQARDADEGGAVLMLMILYLLIGFGILGTVLMMTLERRYEFGVLVAVGMRRSRLAAMVLIEGLSVSMMGALVGLAASIPFIHYMAEHPIPLQGALAEAYVEYGFDPIFAFSTSPDIFWRQFITVAIIAMVVSVYPLYRIGKLEPVEAMRAG
jgi:ABC-type lipoprotein release transport system permease subunit